MKSNHLILGLGGTGGKIIRSFRKAIYEEFREKPIESIALGYLYVDSNQEFMALDDPSWKILGTSVQLDQRSQLLIQEANLGARLNNIDNYPGIKPWIGDPQQWKDVLGSIVGVTLGGQKRRLGRFLFACKADQFKLQIQSLVKELQKSGTTDVTFHVLCGLAGGTGSGSVVDAIAMLRDIYPESKRYRIVVYALLPETYPDPNWDTGNYHANGYAALLELNAISVKRFTPTDLTGVKGRLSVTDAFNGCYLFSNENDNGLTVSVDKQMPGIVADFLYQKIVAARDIAWPELQKFENAENGDGTAESAASSNNPERSKRFLTFGIKRLAVPEQEIGEFLTYKFARQAALQLRFNTWSDSSGFVDESRNIDFHEFVQQKENLLRWALSDEHLTLSTGILPEDANNKRWKPINDEWQDVMPNFKSVVREKARESWLDELAKLCERRFEQDYRGVGVRTFYTTKLKARKEHGREIRRRLESEMFADWSNGVRSVAEVSSLLTALIEALGDRRTFFDNSLALYKGNEEQAANRVALNNNSWSHMGYIQRNVLGKPDSLLDAQGESMREQYIYRTRVEATIFAKQVLEDVIGELTDLKGEVDRAASVVSEAVRRYNDRLAERVTDDGKVDLREQLVRFYDPNMVRSVSARLSKDENEQRTQAAKVRQALTQPLGDRPSFVTFNQRFGTAQDFIDVLDKECAKSSQVAHTNLVVNEKEKLLGVSIIDRLKDRYAGDGQELRGYVTQLVKFAGRFLIFDPSEVSKIGPGIPANVQTAVSNLSVIMPRRPELAEFVSRLEQTFEGAHSGAVSIIKTDTKPNEIALISLSNLFPVRYARQVAFLKEKYDQRLKGTQHDRAALELHLEGDGSQYPRLFVPLQEEMKRDAVPYLLLAKVTGLLREETNSRTGSASLVFVAKDSDGFDTDPIDLGKTLIDSVMKVDSEGADLIKGQVNRLLQSDYVQEDRRAALQKLIVGEVDKVKVIRGNSVTDDVYHQFVDGGRQAVKILRPES